MGNRIELKKPEQLRQMRRAGLVVAETLQTLGAAMATGVTTAELDGLARGVLAAHGAGSSFLNYGADWGYPPFPAVTCISVNEVIVHGIPSSRQLAEGDIVSVDFGAIIEGWHGDAARTFPVGTISAEDQEMIETARLATWAGIAAAATRKGRIGDISHAIESAVRGRSDRYGIIREYTGHGIGSAMHMAPDVPNYGKKGSGPKLAAGMCLAIEPMITSSGEETRELDDDWTVVTANAARAVHWENTVAIMPKGLWVLTEPDGGEAELARLGVPFAPLSD